MTEESKLLDIKVAGGGVQSLVHWFQIMEKEFGGHAMVVILLRSF